MRKLILVPLTVLLLCFAAPGQQTAQPQPLTFYYDYKVNPGKEEEYMNLIKAVGAPVRDKLMAEGVVMAWGVEVPILRYPGGTTHLIWFSVENWAGVEKVLKAMDAQLARIAADETKTTQTSPRTKSSMTTAERIRDVLDTSKTRDWLTRDIVFAATTTPPAAGVLPYTRYGFVKVKPGKGAEYRRTWEKYNKPVYDKLVADGVILAYGLGVEEVKTDGEFTHFSWVATPTMAASDKVIAAFNEDRRRRSEEERTAIAELFTSLIEPDKSRQMVTRAIIFKVMGQKAVSDR
jgi:hypothetical protein